ncbi:MAG: hypothetical protein AB1610_01315 [Nitrospirota bacterium]
MKKMAVFFSGVVIIFGISCFLGYVQSPLFGSQPPISDSVNIEEITKLKEEIKDNIHTNTDNFKMRINIVEKWVRDIILRGSGPQLARDVPPGTLQQIKNDFQRGKTDTAIKELDRVLNALIRIDETTSPPMGIMQMGSSVEHSGVHERPPFGGRHMEGALGPVSERELPVPPIDTASMFNREIMDKYEDSPFGFLDAVQHKGDLFSWNNNYKVLLKELNVHWVKAGGPFGFVWNMVQNKLPDGSYSPFNWERLDRLVNDLHRNNIHLLGVIGSAEPEVGKKGRILPALPRDMDAYKRFVSSLVERYDADGKNDAPGLLYPIRYWLIGDEPFSSQYWGGSAEEYALLLNITYDEIKKTDPNAKVIAATVYAREKDFAKRFFKKLSEITGGKNKYDFLDQHWFIDEGRPAEIQYKEIKDKIEYINNLATRHGFKSVPFWVTETCGVYSPEDVHARDLVKRYIFSLAIGAKKVFWTGLAGARESQFGREDPFALSAILDGDRKKNAFSAYKLMAEKLEGINKGHIEQMSIDSDIFACKFVMGNRSLIVLWSDYGEKIINIPLPPNISSVKVTDAITAASTTLMKDKDKITLKIGKNPVYLEMLRQ